MGGASGRADFALVLGAGGARGLAHIAVIEALDELGVRPARIVGASMGAVVGAAYAAGLAGRELRAHALATLSDRAALVATLVAARIGRLADLRGFGNPVLIDGERLLDLMWPPAVPDRFEELALPFVAVATDFQRQERVVFASGPLTPAVAASLAIPGLVKPILLGGRVLIDGGATDPLPFDLGEGLPVVAVDVSAPPAVSFEPVAPTTLEVLTGVSQILTRTLVQRALEHRAPDLLIRAGLDGVGGLDFGKAEAILAASERFKQEALRGIAALLDR